MNYSPGAFPRVSEKQLGAQSPLSMSCRQSTDWLAEARGSSWDGNRLADKGAAGGWGGVPLGREGRRRGEEQEGRRQGCVQPYKPWTYDVSGWRLDWSLPQMG